MSLCLIAERCEGSERSEANNHGFFEIFVYIHTYLSVHALHKTVHTLSKSYHVGPLCIVFQKIGCCSEHHFEELPF